MDYKNYDYSATSYGMEFKFISSGTSGVFNEIVQYTPVPYANLPLWTGWTGQVDLVNLGFGVLSNNGEIDDSIVTNNGDTNQILTTVALTVQEFFRCYPHYWIYFEGSSLSRTVLYGKKISRHLNEFSNFCNIYGYSTGTTTFMPMSADVRFYGFLINKRASNEDNKEN